mgnify:CR=1 FL=1
MLRKYLLSGSSFVEGPELHLNVLSFSVGVRTFLSTKPVSAYEGSWMSKIGGRGLLDLPLITSVSAKRKSVGLLLSLL